MKQNTKTIVIAGAALAGVYLISQSGGEQAGGFGGGGGIPLLPGDVGDAGDGGSITTTILETVKMPSEFFDENEVKKTAATPHDPGFKWNDLITSLENPDFGDQTGMLATDYFGLSESERSKFHETGVVTKKPTKPAEAEGKPWWNPFSWNLGDALDNYGEYSNRTWGITDTPEEAESFFGGGKSGGKGFSGSFAPVSKKNIVSTTQRRAAQSSSASRGYSRMGANVSHSAGWRQMGAKKPTAPGQPDRY